MRKLILFCLVASSILGLQGASAQEGRTSAKHLELSCLFAKSIEYGKTQVEEMETYQTLNNDSSMRLITLTLRFIRLFTVERLARRTFWSGLGRVKRWVIMFSQPLIP
jgi:hypothetical protein